MLTIEIKVNGVLVAGATARNLSNLADVSDYEIMTVEKRSEHAGHETDMRTNFEIERHPRLQSVWALVEKIARTSAALRKDMP